MREIISPLDGIRSPFRTARGRFSPVSLFAASEPGGWYDPSDLTTLFQDAAGTTAAALESPVGLVLDKSKGLVLGSETSPALSAYITELTGTWAASGANYAFTDTVGGQVRPGVQWPSISLTPGWYRVVVVVASITGATQIRMDGVGASDQLLTTGTNTRTVLVTVNSRPRLRLEDTSTTIGDGFAITSVSIRELPGNHLSQSTSTARPVLSARVNLLTRTEEFDNAAWTKSGVSASGTTITATAATGGNAYLYQAPLVSVASHLFTAKVKAGTSSVFWLFYNGVASHGAAYFDLSDQSTQIGTGSIASPSDLSITGLGNGEYRISAKWTAAAASNNWGIGIADAKGSISVTNGRTASLYNADLRPANAGVGLPAHQRVGASTDYDATGFPYYLRFDGTDDFLVSGTISPGSVDKAQVFAGVRKLSDAAISAIVETSTNASSTAGSLVVYSSVGAAGNFAFGLNGSSWGYGQANGFTAPLTNVLAAAFDIGGVSDTDEVAGRINSTAQSLVFSDNPGGTGNFTSQPVYVGSRAGTSLRFNGQLYSLILRFSATNLDATNIAATETWVNGKTKAF